MELKPYQEEVINDLEHFLKIIHNAKTLEEGFYDFWNTHPKTPLQPFAGMAIEPYKNNVPQVPHVCIKVPTAGGKTFIACNAIKTIFTGLQYNVNKAVVWLVPSTTILEQTIKNLKDSRHPYRQKINMHFGSRVEVYDKQALLQGINFNAASVQEYLSIFVLSFDSLKSKNKDDRKVYQENSNLQSFAPYLQGDEDITLMRVIQSLHPVLIVDESHNAESVLSVEMLNNLNPCFILDLTATPRNNSNIISFVDSMALKKENMVKLPVIVSNYNDKTDVINAAMQLRRRLELKAVEEEKQTGRYIRPIVLFQAQPKNAQDTVTFEKIKERLIQAQIPEEEIRIKTSNINEIKGIDLMAKECKVKYIITVNALKEGWDCPFAYILASLADKSSAVDVEQILGRVLRQPYVMNHKSPMLNFCYVLTASSKFLDTLDNIVKALNNAGFSNKDFRAADYTAQEAENETRQHMHALLAESPQAIREEQEPDADFEEYEDKERILSIAETDGDTRAVTEIELRAMEQNDELEETIAYSEQVKKIVLPVELQKQAKVYRIKEAFTELAAGISIPQFYIRKPIGNIFNDDEALLSKEDLLEGFHLSKCDANISFDNNSAEIYGVDLDPSRGDHAPSFWKLIGKMKEEMLPYSLPSSNKEQKVKNCASRIMQIMENIPFVAESEIRKYLYKLLEDYTDSEYRIFEANEHIYTRIIKNKIKNLAEAYSEKQFRDYADTDKIVAKPNYTFAKEIIPGAVSKNIAKSLYEKEAAMNGFEEKVINEIANLPNVIFWTKNAEKKQFKINGFINHYPDFIIQTQRKTIVLETKGDDRDNSDSDAKIQLGKAWEQKAGNNFKYFMVFEKQEVPGAHTLAGFLKLLTEM